MLPGDIVWNFIKKSGIDSDSDIKIIQEESPLSYGTCGIPYVIEGLISNFGRTKVFPNIHTI